MGNTTAPLKLTIYGVNDEIKREVTRSIIPWGILEKALDLQEEFENIEFDEKNNPVGVNRDQIEKLTDFVVFMFDDAVKPDELKRGASLKDMFALYKQIFTMVSEIMPNKNPTMALANQKAILNKVRQGKRR